MSENLILNQKIELLSIIYENIATPTTDPKTIKEHYEQAIKLLEPETEKE